MRPNVPLAIVACAMTALPACSDDAADSTDAGGTMDATSDAAATPDAATPGDAARGMDATVGSDGGATLGPPTYFVTQDGSGARSGTSLDDAWSVADFNSSTAPTGGDVVGFFGTITSTVRPGSSGTDDGPDRLGLDFSAASLDEADPRIDVNGQSYLTMIGGTLGSASHGTLISFGGHASHDVTVSGFTHAGATTSTAQFVDATYASNLLIANNRADDVAGFVIDYMSAAHDIVISGNDVRTSLNTSVQTDIVFIGDGTDITIEGNRFVQRTDGATSERHNDVIQTFRSGAADHASPTRWIIRYNWMELAVSGGSGDNSWMMMENMTGDPACEIYGNVFVGTGNPLPGGNGLSPNSNDASAHFYFYNNTVVRHEQPVNAIRFLSPGVLYARNNIGVSDAPCSCTLLEWGMTAGETWNNNFFFHFDGCNGTFTGPDGSCDTAPGFVDQAENDFALTGTSALVGAGDSSIGSDYARGIAAGATWPSPSLVARPAGAWDVGAFQTVP